MTPGIDLTPQDAERLRQILDAYQTKNPVSIQEFDLANPKVKPYRHQEYPLVLRNHDTGEEKQARNRAEEDALTDKGFIREALPPAPEPAIEIELSDDEKALIAEAEAANKPKVAPKPKAKPGRKPKTVPQAE